jgi:hypothetical protein
VPRPRRLPLWAGLLAALLQDHSPEALTIMLEEVLQTRPDAKAAPPTAAG